ncbi:MAG: AlpA family phage regulatory protein [Chromatiales bacterium]|nr:AlpA family phage regulatory protein [Chromatiales bacterium]
MPAASGPAEPHVTRRISALPFQWKGTTVSSSTSVPAANGGGICQRAVRRRELRKIVPLADTTIYEMERRGEFPRRFYLTSKCVVWDLAEVEQWLTARRAACHAGEMRRAPDPNVCQRKVRPVDVAGR